MRAASPLRDMHVRAVSPSAGRHPGSSPSRARPFLQQPGAAATLSADSEGMAAPFMLPGSPRKLAMLADSPPKQLSRLSPPATPQPAAELASADISGGGSKRKPDGSGGGACKVQRKGRFVVVEYGDVVSAAKAATLAAMVSSGHEDGGAGAAHAAAYAALKHAAAAQPHAHALDESPPFSHTLNVRDQPMPCRAPPPSPTEVPAALLSQAHWQAPAPTAAAAPLPASSLMQPIASNPAATAAAAAAAVVEHAVCQCTEQVMALGGMVQATAGAQEQVRGSQDQARGATLQGRASTPVCRPPQLLDLPLVRWHTPAVVRSSTPALPDSPNAAGGRNPATLPRLAGQPPAPQQQQPTQPSSTGSVAAEQSAGITGSPERGSTTSTSSIGSPVAARAYRKGRFSVQEIVTPAPSVVAAPALAPILATPSTPTASHSTIVAPSSATTTGGSPTSVSTTSATPTASTASQRRQGHWQVDSWWLGGTMPSPFAGSPPSNHPSVLHSSAGSSVEGLAQMADRLGTAGESCGMESTCAVGGAGLAGPLPSTASEASSVQPPSMLRPAEAAMQAAAPAVGVSRPLFITTATAASGPAQQPPSECTPASIRLGPGPCDSGASFASWVSPGLMSRLQQQQGNQQQQGQQQQGQSMERSTSAAMQLAERLGLEQCNAPDPDFGLAIRMAHRVAPPGAPRAVASNETAQPAAVQPTVAAQQGAMGAAVGVSRPILAALPVPVPTVSNTTPTAFGSLSASSPLSEVCAAQQPAAALPRLNGVAAANDAGGPAPAPSTALAGTGKPPVARKVGRFTVREGH